MEDKFVARFESGGLKYMCMVTSCSCGPDTFFLVSYHRNDNKSETRSFEIEMRGEGSQVPVWALRNESPYQEEKIPGEFIHLIGQKINHYYDLMLYGSYNKQ
jgi:hypothetical protein